MREIKIESQLENLRRPLVSKRRKEVFKKRHL